jgi:hypothetical protein
MAVAPGRIHLRDDSCIVGSVELAGVLAERVGSTMADLA